MSDDARKWQRAECCEFKVDRGSGMPTRNITYSIVALVLVLLFASNVSAFQVYRGTDFKVLWDTKVKYSNQFRVEGQNFSLIDDPNSDDGNRNFDKGLVSNRLDISSELDVLYRQFGLRVSGAAWYDLVYDKDNDNDSPATSNSFSVSHDEFTDDTRKLHGRDAELLDAFVFGSGTWGDMLGTIRVGQHTLLWGESLFFATNGISNGQAPLDVIRLIGVPGTKAKELFLPVPQISAILQPSESLSFEAFYQWHWKETRLPAAGSYLSDADILDEGGERLFAPGSPPGTALFRGEDLEARDSGQWGVAVRLQPPSVDVEFGLYYYVYHDRVPQVYITPGLVDTPLGPMVIDPTVVDLSVGKIGEYSLVFGEDIKVVGASFSTQVGSANVSGEVSYRMDTPLVSSPQVVLPGMTADNKSNPLYAVGDTLHANISTTHFLSPGALWDGGVFLGEVGWNRYVSIDKNSAALAPGRERDAWGFRFVLEPAYYQVLPGVDIKIPLGLGYNPRGRSAVDLKFNGGADRGGDWSIGVKVDYLQAWQFSLAYTDFFGDSDYQTLKDRDLVSFSVQYTF